MPLPWPLHKNTPCIRPSPSMGEGLYTLSIHHERITSFHLLNSQAFRESNSLLTLKKPHRERKSDMRFKQSVALSASVLIGALAASPVYAVNCSISYYCYRSMTPGPAPAEPVVRPRANVPTANGDRLVRRPNAPAAVPASPANNQPQLTAEQRRAQQQAEQQRLAAQRRAQQQAQQQAQQRAQQQRLAAQRAQQQRAQQQRTVTPAVATQANNQQAEQQRLAAERRAAEQLLAQRRAAQQAATQRNATAAAPAPAVPAATPQSCSTLTLKVRELERQATIYARTKEQKKSQRMFQLAATMRKDAEKQSCPAI